MTIIYSKSAKTMIEVWTEDYFQEGNNDGEFYGEIETVLRSNKTKFKSINERVNFNLVASLRWHKKNGETILIQP